MASQTFMPNERTNDFKSKESGVHVISPKELPCFGTCTDWTYLAQLDTRIVIGEEEPSI